MNEIGPKNPDYSPKPTGRGRLTKDQAETVKASAGRIFEALTSLTRSSDSVGHSEAQVSGTLVKIKGLR